MIGKMLPTNNPAWRLSPIFCDIIPTVPGPIDPPKSPAIAKSANIAVPPDGNFWDTMLNVPGHIIPTENPQVIQPVSAIIGFWKSEASM